MGTLQHTLTSEGEGRVTYLLLLLDHPLELCALLLNHCFLLLELCALLLELCALLLDHLFLLVDGLLLLADGDVVLIGRLQGRLEDGLVGIAACTQHADQVKGGTQVT